MAQQRKKKLKAKRLQRSFARQQPLKHTSRTTSQAPFEEAQSLLSCLIDWLED
jgi:hypothetical protein